MSKEMDSAALVLLRQSLGLAGAAGGSTILEEDSVTQVIDVGSFARQGLPPGNNGLFYFLLQATTSVANPSLSATSNVYNPTDGTTDFNQPPFPLLVPDQFDIYLINCSLGLDNTTFTAAILQRIIPTTATGWGVHNNDTTVEAITSASQPVPIAVWDGAVTAVGVEMGTLNGEDGLQRIGVRMIRGESLRLRVSAGGINVVTCFVLAALMPRALGQDVGV